jgi:cell division protein FtsB
MNKKSLISILAVAMGVPAIIYVAYRAVQEGKRNKEINDEIRIMQEEAERIRRDNKDLRSKISYFETPDYQEKVAKEKLNLQKEGEQVVIIKPSPSAGTREDAFGLESTEVSGDSRPNYRKWWDYFFKY